jgi:hypothetical protein
MPDLLGAYSLSGEAIGRLLDPADMQAMRRSLISPPNETIEQGRLWLCVDADALGRNERRWVAAVGFVAGDFLGSDSAPQGHYVCADFDRRSDTLTLSRSFSGGERLYFTRLGKLVLFASTVRPLLAHPRVKRRLNENVLDEVLLTGLTMFGQETLHAGIDEVLAGHRLVISDSVERQRWSNVDVLRSPVGSPEELGKEFRDKLTEAVVAAAGPERPVAVALSGGIDSSAVAAAAVDAFGADGVEAITYEFDDPKHATELEYANLVASHLGIERHHVFKLSQEDYLNAIPEMVWRSESLVHWPKAFMLLVAREVKARGYDRYLTGFGIGSHMSFMNELGGALSAAPMPGAMLAPWRRSRFGHSAWSDRFARLHPAMERPHPRIYYLLVRMLHRAGYIRDLSRFFPPELSPLLQNVRAIDELEPDLADRPLGQQLQLQAFSHLVSCIDVTRSEKASRELGVYRVSPAHFASCIPYAYFPIEPKPRIYTDARALRPGKLLLRHGFRGAVPDEVLFRVKSWGDAVASDRWLREGRRLMLSVLPSFPGDTSRYGQAYPKTIQFWEGRSILATSLALRLWERIFIELPLQDEPPSWHSLWESLESRRLTGTEQRKSA